MSAARPPILIGETNPYGSEPYFALYHLPRSSAGGRLQRVILGIPAHEYLSFPRYNLCYGLWKLPAARLEIARRGDELQGHTLVFLGRKVCTAFRVAYEPVTANGTSSAYHRFRYVVLPHPSGLNRMWNQPGIIERVRDLMRSEFPHIKFGSLDSAGD